MASPFDVLIERYPMLAGDIQQAAQAGYDPDTVQQSINNFTRALRQSGLDPAQTYSTLTGQSPNPPDDPGTLKRILASALRGATLGLAGEHYEPDPYASTSKMLATDWAPELISNILPFKLAGKAVQATGAPAALGRLVGKTGLPRTLQGALTSGATEAATFGAVGAAGEGINVWRGQEFDPSRILQDVILGAGMGAAGGWARTRALIKRTEALAAQRAEVEAAARKAQQDAEGGTYNPEEHARVEATIKALDSERAYQQQVMDDILRAIEGERLSNNVQPVGLPAQAGQARQALDRLPSAGPEPARTLQRQQATEAARLLESTEMRGTPAPLEPKDQFTLLGPPADFLPEELAVPRRQRPGPKTAEVPYGDIEFRPEPTPETWTEPGRMPVGAQTDQAIHLASLPQQAGLAHSLLYDPTRAPKGQLLAQLKALRARLDAEGAPSTVRDLINKKIMQAEEASTTASRVLDQAAIDRLQSAAAAQGLPEAPAVFAYRSNGSSNGKVPAFDSWHLTQDIPGHPAGSTVSSQTLLQAGYTLPAKAAASLSETQQGLLSRARQVYEYWQGRSGNYKPSRVAVESKREGTFKNAQVVNEARARARIAALEPLLKKAEAGTLTTEEAAALDRMYQNMLDNTRKRGPKPEPKSEVVEAASPQRPSEAVDYFGESAPVQGGRPDAEGVASGRLQAKADALLTPKAVLDALPAEVMDMQPREILKAYQAGQFSGDAARAVREYLLENLKVKDPLNLIKEADVQFATKKLEALVRAGGDPLTILDDAAEHSPKLVPVLKRALSNILRRNGQRPEGVIGSEAPNAGEAELARRELPLVARNAETPVPAGVVPTLPQGRMDGSLPPERVQAMAKVVDAEPTVKPAPIQEAQAFLGRPLKMADDVAQAVVTLRDAAVGPEALSQALQTLPPKVRAHRAVMEAVQKAKATLAERNLRQTKDGRPMVCASPCEVLPPGREKLTDADRARLDQDLAVGGIQRNVALERKGLSGMLRRWSNLFKEGGLWEFRSYSEVAHGAQDPAAIELAKYFDQISRQAERWRGGVAKRANEAFRVVETSEDDFLLGTIMNNPGARHNAEFMAAQKPEVRKAYEFMEGILRETAQMRGVQDANFTGLPDYFTHVFDGRAIRAEAEKMLTMLRAGEVPAGVRPDQIQAIVDDLTTVMAKIDAGAGEALTYRQLPQAFKEAFFEHRQGFAGYSLSAAKSLHTYLEFFARKYFWEPYLPKFKELIGRIKDPNVRHYATLMARDLTGLEQRQWSSQIEGLSATIRNFEFIRTLGTWNVGSALRNLVGGQMFAAVDAGTKHYSRGVAMAMAANQDASGYLARTLESQGHLTDIPIWYARTANNPIGNAARYFAEKSGTLFNMVERGNRRTSFFAGLSKWFETAEGRQFGRGLEEALEAEAVPQAAIEYANRFVQRNQFRYGKADTPWALRGPIGATVLQYASFKIKAMEMLYRWATQEGAAGKARLATLAALGAGVTYAGHLAGLDLSSATGLPVDFLSVVNAAQSMDRGDLETAKRHLMVGLKNGIFETPMGPVAPAMASAYQIGQAWLGGQPVEKRVWTFLERDVMPTQARAVAQAYQDLEAGGSPEQFVARVAGFPNPETRIRLAYLQLLKDGHSQQAQDLLRLYKERTGGTVPVEIAAVRKAKIEALQARIKSRLDKAKERPEDRLRRSLPEHVTRLIP